MKRARAQKLRHARRGMTQGREEVSVTQGGQGGSWKGQGQIMQGYPTKSGFYPKCGAKLLVKSEESVSYSLIYDYKRSLLLLSSEREEHKQGDQQEADQVRDDNGLTPDVSRGMGAVDL